ncbi:fungal-specific transcription factor domain-containing protein [Penicillium malachiteum]|uniref:fungal-specific transcription factor domain-containing protein n=1 Tax=Penicillium malachiteum TaxID=1324776 RepID=UPI0025488282|nr:fungal-specific transcription factor domain-containing protein [Penicillium malachiteum]KAJ5735013.1 fungal-specific transcription factor domain-containing protein [Penicillium malachiteum]
MGQFAASSTSTVCRHSLPHTRFPPALTSTRSYFLDALLLCVMAKPQGAMRHKRKSRGRGLRATTGCLICKRRHVKCDEVHPQCGPCAKGQRPCMYAPRDSPYDRPSPAEGNASRSPTDLPTIDITNDRSSLHEPLQILVDACDQEQPIQYTSPHSESQHATDTIVPDNPASAGAVVPTARSPYTYAPSPGTESSWSSRAAPLSWFELLATDAANADDRFLLSSPQQFPRTHAHTHNQVDTGEDPRNSSNLRPRTLRESQSFNAAAFPQDPEIAQRFASQTPELSSAISSVPSSWSSKYLIDLSPLEHYLFQYFVRISSKWLDFYDPEKHFASSVPQLSLRNVGLMRALLALAARHHSLSEGEPAYPGGVPARAGNTSSHGENTIDRNLAVQYYFESLHYLNKAMQHSSYARSRELIATAILISTYEMIDGSNQDWERHLKGVFWIQRFQDNDGESGGLRSAVWWAWIRQDVWVAMRERRRVFSFWNPKKLVSELSASELATRATYLLAQCVNYASKEEQGASDLERRLDRGSELLFMLQEWHAHLPLEYNPLPVVSSTEIFPPIWVHPPSYAAALQVHSLARILVTLHRPSSGGVEDFRAAQKLLTLSVNTICGIARSVDENDQAANIVSLHTIFGAGMCVSTPHERLALLDILETCQRRVRWPLNSLTKELELEYGKDSFHDLLR